jgi:hypothetical protein
VEYPSDAQSLDRPSVEQVLFNDFVNIFLIYVGIPDSFRINDQHRPFVTAIQATRRVYAYATHTTDPQLLASLFGVLAQPPGIKPLTARAAILAEVGTEEQMVLIVGHGVYLLTWVTVVSSAQSSGKTGKIQSCEDKGYSSSPASPDSHGTLRISSPILYVGARHLRSAPEPGK